MMSNDPIDPRLEELLVERRKLRKLLETTPPTNQPWHYVLNIAIAGLAARIKLRRAELGIVPEKGKEVGP